MLLTGCVAQRSAAQFIGYTSPQTVQQTLATNVTCGGLSTPQAYTVQNLGQTQHFAMAQPGGTTAFEMELQGVDTAGFTYRISDQVRNTSSYNSVFGSGYFPKVIIVVRCQPVSATYTLSYSGASSTPFNTVGAYGAAQIDKLIAGSAAANASFFDQVLQTPFGNSQGVVQFQFGTSASTGSSFTLQCNGFGAGGSSYQLFTFNPAAVTTLQTFFVPTSNCPFVTFAYTSGAGGGTFSAEYIFSQPAFPGLADPCQSPGIPKSSAVITAPATATTQIVALSGNTSIYVCGYQGSQSAAGAYQWEFGTGASCGTGTTALTGVETTLSGTPVLDGDAGITIFKAPPGTAACIVTSVAGTFNGKLTYVQQ